MTPSEFEIARQKVNAKYDGQYQLVEPGFTDVLVLHPTNDGFRANIEFFLIVLARKPAVSSRVIYYVRIIENHKKHNCRHYCSDLILALEAENPSEAIDYLNGLYKNSKIKEVIVYFLIGTAILSVITGIIIIIYRYIM